MYIKIKVKFLMKNHMKVFLFIVWDTKYCIVKSLYKLLFIKSIEKYDGFKYLSLIQSNGKYIDLIKKI